MKLVILDRDGVINEDSDDYIKSPEEWIPIDGSINAICELGRHDFIVVVATNQSGIGRGLFDEYDLARIHQKMCSAIEDAGGFIHGIFFCPHAPHENCNCRKPKTGLLSAIASEFNLSLEGIPFIGDSLKDIEAARSSHCDPILVKTGNGEKTLAAISGKDLKGITIATDLRHAVPNIIDRYS
ncbi:MAG: D-glycero-beta-D-manno-heptose 1,7-bisphosphate 7-phosphatase [Gammaproteobacteria bacterium]|nr:D-glycero-beta-D-manno-heptose 1,7-bisphosphate 7-phosphatase [Gammaproteobacteria bacterium]